MTYKQFLDQKRSTATAIFHKFRTSSNPEGCVHIFVEGYEDVIFYGRLMGQIAQSRRGNWKPHISYGKKNMDRIIQMYRQSGMESRKIIFVRDSDFDLHLNIAPVGDDVFLTCGYSVENYVCSRDSIEAFLFSVFSLDEDEVDVKGAVERHFITLDMLFQWMTPFIGAVLNAIKSGEILDLDQIEIGSIYRNIYFGLDIPENFPDNQINNCKLNTAHFNPQSERAGSHFTSLDVHWWLRGKYILECTCEFLKIQDAQYRLKHKQGEIQRFNKRLNPDYSANAVFERLSGFTSATGRLLSSLQDHFVT